MKYPSEIKKKNCEENAERMFNESLQLYLNSSTIEEYIVSRNLKCPSIETYRDIFFWWYVYKERFLSFKIYVYLMAFFVSAIWYSLSTYFELLPWIWCRIAISTAILCIPYLIISVFANIMHAFGNLSVKWPERDRKEQFYWLDEHYSSKK